jgi:amidophosphoribosyltransferase
MCWIVWVYSLKHSSEKEGCSLFGSINASDAIIKALKSNKNRWQDGYGISVLKEDNSIDTFRFKDFNSDVVDFLFERKSSILALIWHSRYPTSWGNNTSEALQPFQHNFDKIEENNEMWFSFSFNGNIVNTKELTTELEEKGYVFKLWGLDTEVLKFLIIDEMENGNTDLKKILETVLGKIDWACNISILDKNGNMAIAKDGNDLHPLSWWIVDNKFVFSSESSALTDLWCDKIDFLKPWEIVEVQWGKKPKKSMLNIKINKTPCIFELIYFSDKNSSIGNKSVSLKRRRLWQQLALNENKDLLDKKNSVVIDVPASSLEQADWFADGLWIKLLTGAIIKKPNAGRTFIANKNDIDALVKEKYFFNPNYREFIEWKDIYLIDDSIVRGKTIIPLIKLLKEHYNPRSVHVRIPSPPIFAPCFYGINMSTPDELIARKYITDIWDLKQEEIESISQHIGADSLNYLSVEWLIKVVWKIKMTQTKIRWACMACLTWIYPTKWWKKRYKELLV